MSSLDVGIRVLPEENTGLVPCFPMAIALGMRRLIIVEKVCFWDVVRVRRKLAMRR
jgi:hypothetical protein